MPVIANKLSTVLQLKVKTAMETIIAKNIFDSNGGDLILISGAEIITRSVEELTVK